MEEKSHIQTTNICDFFSQHCFRPVCGVFVFSKTKKTWTCPRPSEPSGRAQGSFWGLKKKKKKKWEVQKYILNSVNNTISVGQSAINLQLKIVKNVLSLRDPYLLAPARGSLPPSYLNLMEASWIIEIYTPFQKHPKQGFCLWLKDTLTRLHVLIFIP